MNVVNYKENSVSGLKREQFLYRLNAREYCNRSRQEIFSTKLSGGFVSRNNPN